MSLVTQISSFVTRVATEFKTVYAALGVIKSNTQTASYTLVLADAGKTVEMNVATANTLTIPTHASVALPLGCVIEVCQVGTGQTTLAGAAGVTLRAPDGLKLSAQWRSASLRQRVLDEWVVVGSTTA